MCVYIYIYIHIYIYMYHSFFIHSSVSGRPCCFCVLAIANNAAVNIGVHVSFSFMIFSRYMPNSGIVGSDDSFIPSFLRNLHAVLHSGCINLYSHQPFAKRFPFLHTLSSFYCLQIFLMMAILTSVK